MESSNPPDPAQQWRKDHYLVSTDLSLLSLPAINAAFDSPAIYWATSLPEPDLKLMLQSSKCFGLYKLPLSAEPPTTDNSAEPSEIEQIGLARVITDYVSFVWLTDVYVLEPYQGKGVGTWLVKCVDEWMDTLPYLRRAMLLTSSERTERYYVRELGMKRFATRGEAIVMDKFGKGAVFKE